MFKLPIILCFFLTANSTHSLAQSEHIEERHWKTCEDDDGTSSDGKSPCGPFVFLSAIRPDVGFAIFAVKNPGQVFTTKNSSPGLTTEMKFADEADPSIILYMPDDRLKFFIPSIDTDKLKQAPWRYKDCTYHIAATSTLDHSIYRTDDEKSAWVSRRFTVESVCDEAPDEPTQYLFDAAFGLFSFTFGSFVSSDTGEKHFVPGETFFEIRNTYGYGAGKNPFLDSAE